VESEDTALHIKDNCRCRIFTPHSSLPTLYVRSAMKYLLKISFLSFKNKVSSLKIADDLKAAFFIFIGIFLVAAIFGASYGFLRYVNSVALAGPLIVNKLLALIFLTAFMMTALSSVIVSFSSIYFGKDIKWLLSVPIKVNAIFSYKALNAAFYASWMVFAVLIPFLAALAVVKGESVWFCVLSIIFAIPFLASAGFAGTGFAVIVMKFFPAAKIRNMIFITGAVFFTALLVALRLAQPEKFISSEGFQMLSQYLGYLDAPTAKFLPSWWYASAVIGLLSREPSRVIIHFAMLLICAAVVWIIVKMLAKKYFADGLNEGQAFAAANIKKQSFKKRLPLYAIFQKDIKVFFRDSNQWSQILILASIILVYLFSMYKLSFETLKMHNTMSLVNCALVWFVSTAVALRLSFPLISLEGESFWFLLTSPVSRFKLFVEKVIFGTVPVFVTAMILMFATNYMMGISKPVFAVTLAATAFMSLVIGCSAVSVGTILPKFNYTSIPQIESSLGGLVFMLFSFFMIIANIIIVMQPVRLFYSTGYSRAAFLEYGLLLALLNMCLFCIIFISGYNALKRIEK